MNQSVMGTFTGLVAEAKASGPHYRIWYQYVMRHKFVRHYRRMLPLVLEHLTFRSENRFQPVIEALALIKRYVGTKYQYFPEEVPIEGVVLPSWRDTVIEPCKDGERVNRHYYELCVLQRLERALKCKEIWVEGSYDFRSPSEDMPVNWNERRVSYYNVLDQPLDSASFIEPLRAQLTEALTQFNRDLPRNPHVYLYRPAANEDRRLFSVARLTAQPEPPTLSRLQHLIQQRHGALGHMKVDTFGKRYLPTLLAMKLD